MRYSLVENILPFETCVLASKVMLADKNFVDYDEQVPISKSFYTVPYLEVLLPAIQPKLEEVWGKTLIPTYVYSRILYPGAILDPHTDRPSCEYSVTVTLGHNYPEDHSFPIYMEGNPIEIPVGYGATYKGCEVEHWREPLTGNPDNFWIQAFFHYVDANGPYAEWAWDKKY
jgi:hypothetical protein